MPILSCIQVTSILLSDVVIEMLDPLTKQVGLQVEKKALSNLWNLMGNLKEKDNFECIPIWVSSNHTYNYCELPNILIILSPRMSMFPAFVTHDLAESRYAAKHESKYNALNQAIKTISDLIVEVFIMFEHQKPKLGIKVLTPHSCMVFLMIIYPQQAEKCENAKSRRRMITLPKYIDIYLLCKLILLCKLLMHLHSIDIY